MSAIPWDEPATLIDLDGKAPMIGTVRDCAMHFAIFKPFAKAQARILLTKPVHREGQKTRTWILNPDETSNLPRACAARVEQRPLSPRGRTTHSFKRDTVKIRSAALISAHEARAPAGRGKQPSVARAKFC